MYFLSLLYAILTKLRNKLYDFNILKSYKIPNAEIICIGNITVGGTGKTPAVQYFAKKKIEEGRKVGIVSRGYKGVRDKDQLLVRDYENIYATAKSCGDEAYLHGLNLNIPIMVGSNRYKACVKLKKMYNLDCIILDDGFQHRALARDWNIVLIDATNPFGGNALLPKGRLRESIEGLKRASEFIITKSDLVPKQEVEKIIEYLKSYGKKIAIASHGPVSLYNSRTSIALDSIKDKKILSFSALANPENFVKTIEKFNPKEVKNISYPDHYYYKDTDFQEIEKVAREFGADYIISTEKDLVKYKERFDNANLYTLKIEFRILES